jgi:hypothetical protein
MTSAEEADIEALRQLAKAGRVDFLSGRASVARTGIRPWPERLAWR